MNNVQGLWACLSATSDSRGHYRIEGLDTGSFNDLAVSVSDLPYFARTRVNIAPAKSLEPILEDIKLRRGVWAIGLAYDRSTGKPVSGRVQYLPSESNEFAKKFRDNFFDVFSQQCQADAAGHFRAVVMPGRGVLCLLCRTGDYRLDVGRSEIKDQNELRVGPGEYHVIREINAAPEAQEVAVDLPVEPGQNVVLKFTDAAGKPLSGIQTHGLRFSAQRVRMEYGESFVEGDSAILYATYPGEVRHVWLQHRASGLTKLFDFVAKAGETERTIVLDPPAVVIGRLLSEDGTPLAHAPLRTVNQKLGWRRSLDLAAGDDGRFRLELPAGGPFALQTQRARLVDNLTIEPGEQVDLGDITIEPNKRRPLRSKVQRGPEKRTKPCAEVKATTTSIETPSRPNQASGDTAKSVPGTKARELRGRVLLPNGQPAVGTAKDAK